jgi:hypothetical protein
MFSIICTKSFQLQTYKFKVENQQCKKHSNPMLYVKVMAFQSFGDGWKVFIQIMDEKLTTRMKITTIYGWNVPTMDEKGSLWMKNPNK